MKNLVTSQTMLVNTKFMAAYENKAYHSVIATTNARTTEDISFDNRRTVEVRVMDAQPSLGRAVALAALVQGLARHAVEGPAPLDLPGEVLAESDFRAFRYGLDARLVDVDGTLRPARELADTAVRQARDALGAGGAGQPLDSLAAALSEPTECSRQRMLVEDHGMPALLEDLMTTTVTCDW